MKKQFTRLIGACCVSVFLFLISATTTSAQYCTSGSVNDGEWLSNVTFAGINNSSVETSYSDFTSISGTVSPGITYEFSGTIGQTGAYTELITVYIDWDQSETFEESERYEIGSCTSNGCTLTADIAVPATAVPGETRMRVIQKFNTIPDGPCGDISFGEVEDYTINVQTGECTPPTLTYTVTNDCVNDTYSLVVLIDSLGSSASGTIFHKRSDGVSMSNTTLIPQLVGIPLTISNNIPFGVTIRDSIVSGNPICTLIRNFQENICIAENDEICGAITLACGDTISQAYITATPSPEGDCADGVTNDLWYKITVQEGLTYKIVFENATTTEVLDGDECTDDLIQDIFCTPTTGITFGDAGSYFIRVQPYLGTDSIHISLNCYGAPDNGDCVSATEIDCEGTYTGSTVAAPDQDPAQPFCGTSAPEDGRGVWFTYEPEENINMNFDLSGSSFDTKLFLYTNTCGSLVCVDGDDNSGDGVTSMLDASLSVGSTYYLYVTGILNWNGEFVLNTTCTPVDCPEYGNYGQPCDDGDPATVDATVSEDCECTGGRIPIPGEVCEGPGGPIEIDEVPYTTTDNTTGYRNDYISADIPPLAPGAIISGTSVNYYLSGNDVVYSYIPSGPEVLNISVSSHGTYAGLFVFTGCPFALTQGYSVNSSGTDSLKIHGLTALQGETYYIVITTWTTPLTTPYKLDITKLGDCEGAPSAGIIDSEDMMVCAASPITLATVGASEQASGLLLTWQSSPADADQWTDITGANSPTYILEEGITVPTDFRFFAECAISDEADSSNVLALTINPVITECYCTPTNGYSESYYISSVSTNGALQDLDRSSGFTTGGYADYTATDTLIAYANQEFDFSVTWPSSTYNVGVWVDFNQNGSFADADEQIILSGFGSSPYQGTIVVPDSVADGSYRMRVRANYIGTPVACGDDNYAEAEDYIVKIITLNECAGTPTAGTVQDDSFNVCAANDFNLTVSGATSPANGLERNWQSKPADLNDWADIPGATSTSYNAAGINTPTDFRYRATCLNTQETDYSNVVQVGINPANECYCIPTTTGATAYLDGFSASGDSGQDIGNTNSGPSLDGNGYSDYTNLPAVLAYATGDVEFTAVIGPEPATAGVRIWVDWGRNGTFGDQASGDPAEVVYSSSSYLSTQNGSFTIPEDAVGTYRLRVGASYIPATGPDSPCGQPSYGGEYEDYSLEVFQLDMCSGTPEAGTADVEELSVCANIPFTLSTSGSSEPADGFVKTWQSSIDGGTTWSDITGSNSSTYVHPGVDVATLFRYSVTCSYSSQTDVSNVIGVSLNPPLECYCIPTNGYSESYYISSVSTDGALQDLDRSSGFTTGGYADYTATDTLIAYANQEFDFSVTWPSSTYNVGVWVDFSQNGSFADADEQIILSGSGSSPYQGTIVVPDGLADGSYRMRVRANYIGTPVACGDDDYAEAEDYVLKVITLSGCSGTPTAGTAEDSFNVCASNQFSLTVSGASSPAEALERNWQSKPADLNDWADILGATSTNYIVDGGILTPTDFRYRVTCLNSNETDYSNVVAVGLNPGIDCYCTPSGAANNADEILNFTFANINNTSAPSEGVAGYADYTDTVAAAEIVPGESYVASLTSNSGSGNHGAAIWIDYNDNGVFEAFERVTSLPSSIGGSSTASFPSFEVENMPGLHRLRVQYRYNVAGSDLDPCVASTFTDTEDYMVNVAQLDACFGTPEGGTVDENEISVCANIAFELNVSGASDLADGLTRIWQSLPAGEVNWADVANATSPSYTVANGINVPTDFRYKVECANSNETDVSDVVQVSLNPALECYCTPTNGYSDSYGISNFSTAGALQDVNNSSGFTPGGYADYTGTDTVEVYAGLEFNFSIESTTASSYYYNVWIDFNQNGSFADDGDFIMTSDGSLSGIFVGTYTIPHNLDPGSYRLRIRNAWLGGSPPACGDIDYGEAEDYIITVIQLDACSGTPEAGIADADQLDICGNVPFTLSVSGSSDPADGLVTIWQSSIDNGETWTDIDGAFSSTYVHPGVSQATLFRYSVTCTFSEESDVSNVIGTSLNPADECYCTPTTANNTYYITGFSATGDGVQDISNTGTLSSLDGNGYSDYTDLPALTASAGGEVDFTADVNSSSNAGFRIWVDWGKNGSFGDQASGEPNEVVYSSTGYLYTHTGSFAIPANASGTYRIRIGSSYTPSSGPATPCLQTSGGEFEDYMLNVSELSSSSLTGTISNWSSSCSDRNATVKLYEPGTATLVTTYNVAVGSDGTFTVDDVAIGTFDVIVKAEGYLAKGTQDVAIAAGDNSMSVGVIINGDINNDNSVNIADVSIFSVAYGSSLGGPTFNPLADMDCSGGVSIADFSLLSQSYGQGGDTAPLGN